MVRHKFATGWKTISGKPFPKSKRPHIEAWYRFFCPTCTKGIWIPATAPYDFVFSSATCRLPPTIMCRYCHSVWSLPTPPSTDLTPGQKDEHTYLGNRSHSSW